MARHFSCLVLSFSASWLLLAALAPRTAVADEALHVTIDRLIEEANFGVVAPVASDGEFLRRLYLDLTGSIPPSSVAREFLSDASADKRERMVDRLLASPYYDRHMTNVLDVMLLERRSEKNVKNDEWQTYLYDSIAANKPWDQLTREILAADGTDEKIRSATAFYFTREAEPNLLTRDIGRIFFGMDLQCAQCHDHPLISSYYQADYYGIFAFVSRGTLFTDKEKKVFYAEKADGDVSFTSVFTKEQDRTFPRLPTGFEIDEPFFPMGEDYAVAPADNVRPVPKYSRRAQLAELTTSGTNRQFNKNIANRLWAHMMGRGLVEPVDLHHADNPPSHPELLELLGDQFAAMKYDMKALLRELALSNTYQRSLETPATLAEQATAIEPLVEILTTESEQVAERLAQATAAVKQLDTELDQAKGLAAPIFEELTKANAAIGEARKAADKAAQTLAASQTELTPKQTAAQLLSGIAANTGAAAATLTDAALVEAAAKFQARADQLAKEVAALTKAVADKTPPAEATAATLAQAKAAAEEIRQRFETAREQVKLFEPQLATALREQQQHERAKLLTQSRLQVAKRILGYAESLGAVAQTQEPQAREEAELAATRLHEELVERLEKQFSTNRLEHLSPEQMATAILQATGMVEIQRTVGEAEVNKKMPQDPEKAADATHQMLREKEIEAFVYEKLKGHVATFVKLFGHTGGQPQADFFATVDQALFFANGGTVLSWLNPAGNNLTARLQKLQEPAEIADELYLTVLTRPPVEAEVQEVAEYLATRAEDKLGAVKEMTWALITSAEFRFSH